MKRTYISNNKKTGVDIVVLVGEVAEKWKQDNSGNVFATDINGSIVDGIIPSADYRYINK